MVNIYPLIHKYIMKPKSSPKNFFLNHDITVS